MGKAKKRVKSYKDILTLLDHKEFEGVVLKSMRKVYGAYPTLTNEDFISIFREYDFEHSEVFSFDTLVQTAVGNDPFKGFKLEDVNFGMVARGASPLYLVRISDGYIRYLCRNKGGDTRDLWNIFPLMDMLESKRFFSIVEEKELSLHYLNCNAIEVDGIYLLPKAAHSMYVTSEPVDLNEDGTFSKEVKFFNAKQYLCALLRIIRIRGYARELDDVLRRAWAAYRYGKSVNSLMSLFCEYENHSKQKLSRYPICDLGNGTHLHFCKTIESFSMTNAESVVGLIIESIADMRGMKEKALREELFSGVLCHGGYNETVQGDYNESMIVR